MKKIIFFNILFYHNIFTHDNYIGKQYYDTNGNILTIQSDKEKTDISDELFNKISNSNVSDLHIKELDLILALAHNFDSNIVYQIDKLSKTEKQNIVSGMYNEKKGNKLLSWGEAYQFFISKGTIDKAKSFIIAVGCAYAALKFLMPIYQPIVHKIIKKYLFKISIQPDKNKEIINIQKNLNENFFGYTEIKQKIQKIIHQLKKFKKSGELKFIEGAIFYGDPGCGKTYMVKLLAQYADIPLFSFSLSKIINKTGSIADNIKIIFEQVQYYAEKNQTPVIVFIDEIDMIIPSRETQSTLTQEEKILLQDFLEELTNTKGVFVVGNTNYLNKLDAALLRHGRLGNHINFHLPNQNDITEIIINLLKEKQIIGLESELDFFINAFLGKNITYINNFFNNYKEYSIDKKIAYNTKNLKEYIEKFGI